MKMTHIIPLVAAGIFLLSNCGKSDPDYSAFYKDPEEADPSYTDNSGLEDNQILVISSNIRYYNTVDTETKAWDYRKTAFQLLFAEREPAVAGLQEVRLPQKQWLDENLPGYKSIGVGRRNNGAASDEYVPIYYRTTTVKLIKWGTFWLSETPDVAGSSSWGSSVPRIATWAFFKHYKSGKEFLFINTHIDTGGDAAAPGKQMEVIVAKIGELNTNNLPTFLMADFNALATSPIMTSIRTFMTNVREVAPVTDNKSTYQAFGTSGLIVDHIYTSGLSALKYETIDKTYGEVPYISDHYPIAGTLQYN